MNVSFLQELLNTVAEQGRSLLPKSLFREDPDRGLQALVQALVSERGEASGVAIARQLLHHYKLLKAEEREAFFRYIAHTLTPESSRVADAARAYLDKPSPGSLLNLQKAVESPRQEFFRRLNLAPGATADLVAMRRDLLGFLKKYPELTVVDSDLRHLLYSWFNRGFLVLRRIDWQTSASILEKIIAYEAVHEIKGWEDLRRRLDPADRRCFAFFHPSLIDDPLIFVEVALMQDIPGAIAPVLHEPAKSEPIENPTTAVFYSISNCQEGLKGVSFGNFLIKQVVEELVREVPSLKTFVTLSPVPTFARWLEKESLDAASEVVTEEDREVLTSLKPASWASSEQENAELKASVLALAADYFLRAKSADNKPVDPVARFHLGNGARLERINWLGDTSEKGLREAHGLMVNYRYELKEIEKNHEAYANDGPVACSRAVKALLRSPSKTKSFVKTVVQPEPPKALAPPKKSPEEDKIEAPAMPKAE
ncbi:MULTISPECIES: malonyl-CoA decarboxylase [Filomicrobium]|uniref:Malonyl-CoA decarboxylase n=1 Tax=Filomicrobium insigne TaxID=418854 RepID=A0A1H0TA59_9HYPH|nr:MULTISPECIES: malonyl-CoA decarboxylase [Filomicrobium]MCV0371401.1 malonyl-CoA decarboxylase [Filomicrobium sp.]SDP50907.1 malonyl-CoA decarboxylase [Filomicrobium insigne]